MQVILALVVVIALFVIAVTFGAARLARNADETEPAMLSAMDLPAWAVSKPGARIVEREILLGDIVRCSTNTGRRATVKVVGHNRRGYALQPVSQPFATPFRRRADQIAA